MNPCQACGGNAWTVAEETDEGLQRVRAALNNFNLAAHHYRLCEMCGSIAQSDMPAKKVVLGTETRTERLLRAVLGSEFLMHEDFEAVARTAMKFVRHLECAMDADVTKSELDAVVVSGAVFDSTRVSMSREQFEEYVKRAFKRLQLPQMIGCDFIQSMDVVINE